MNSITKFNKPILDLYSNTIQELIDKLKVNIPEEYHSIMDEQFKQDFAVMKLYIKNTNKIKNKHIDAPKKPTRKNGWQVFCAEKSKELTNVPQNEKWTILSKEWAELKSNGGDKYWRDLADTRNSKITDNSDNTSITSDVSETTPFQEDEDKPEPEPQPQPTKAKAKAKTTAPKKATKKAPKNAKDNDDDDDQQPQIIFD